MVTRVISAFFFILAVLTLLDFVSIATTGTEFATVIYDVTQHRFADFVFSVEPEMTQTEFLTANLVIVTVLIVFTMVCYMGMMRKVENKEYRW